MMPHINYNVSEVVNIRHLKNILKISIILMLLIVVAGSAYAADDSQSKITDSLDDFELDEEFDDDLEDIDDDSDDDLDGDDEDIDDDFDDDLDGDDEDIDDDSDDDLDEYNDTELDVNMSDYDYLEFKILRYLEKYGNCTDENWTSSEKFLNEYRTYLENPSNYTLNESAEGYQTYLKIYDSITSTFEDYNLTENETTYLKFLIIFYLNNYGNVSANYTWNETEDGFEYFNPWFTVDACLGSASFECPIISNHYYALKNLNNIFDTILTNSTDVNMTSTGSNEYIAPPAHSYGWENILMLVLIVVLVTFVFI